MEGRNARSPSALGSDARFRSAQDFAARGAAERKPSIAVETLFLNCGGAELKRRYAETRHRHPLAMDRAADDGIAHERACSRRCATWPTACSTRPT
jgi:UPF0042 nucleotide-binding protein